MHNDIDNNNNNYVPTYVEYWYQRSWRPMMAAIYMILCVIDYGVRPFINYYNARYYSLSEIVEIIKDLDPSTQIRVMELYRRDLISPILTEFVHLAFGTVLGISAFSRGLNKNFQSGSINK